MRLDVIFVATQSSLQFFKRKGNYKPRENDITVADSKREEFRKYLEKAGVMDALTKVLVNLYEEPEKPANALDFMKEHLHGGPPETADIEALKNEVSDLRQKVEQLTAENTELKQRVSMKICSSFPQGE
ncbi:unnamed protein product [Porites lobata]|uniref:c-Myc-binding protein n=1 Tax=Porites lobata TaxID=104759 RepID=A0ABN8P2F6_9CNID|nr:unnamed protein product [Porites lobata]